MSFPFEIEYFFFSLESLFLYLGAITIWIGIIQHFLLASMGHYLLKHHKLHFHCEITCSVGFPSGESKSRIVAQLTSKCPSTLRSYYPSPNQIQQKWLECHLVIWEEKLSVGLRISLVITHTHKYRLIKNCVWLIRECTACILSA